MVDKLCSLLTNRIRKSMPEVDDERAEIIEYGIKLILGEIPKIFIVMIIAYFLGLLEYTVLAFVMLLPYRAFSGGFHLKTHIGCIVGTTLFYCGNAFLSKYLILEPVLVKYLIIFGIWLFSIISISLYAPADTENFPILRQKERIIKRYSSYIVVTVGLIIAILITDKIFSNILIIGTLLQSLSITKIAYKLTGNKYGYEVYS